MSAPLRSMRIFALPLSKNLAKSPTSVPLVFYHVQMPAVAVSQAGSTPLHKRALNWTANTWNSWGEAKGGWKLKVHTYGEKVIERIEFEENALKSVDTALGPALASLSKIKEINPSDSTEGGVATRIPLFHPTSFSNPQPLDHLKSFLAHRGPAHRKYFYLWLGAIPFTAPFMVIPIIPNLPFFFCAWRAWSHWRAFRAADYLQSLVEHSVVVPTPSPTLDRLYQSDASDTADSLQSLNPARIPEFISTYDLSSTTATELGRAIDQAKLRSEKSANTDSQKDK
ncbi:hypothetical protein BOTBODRAFT_142251 [Botryobasidium botryosum FD-172 SS1]|uniref:Mitochondrial K+-H+ exchange-related-domain-containing protein n=1 Tax=Botryobasidium botryosum (strain FD-172 SS1) TaxID=930990 RepID=A0A067MYH7_BOTB1|nr:hypothetical protein BOTBODRAFT_142251 [Botryobasidium botryosum FD-172 SS1]